MASTNAQSFMDGLKRLEETDDPEALVRLFAQDAELESPARQATFRGADGARQFWQDYLNAFNEIRSEFTHVAEADRFAALEWRSSGRLPDGSPLNYRGVSLVEFDGENRVRRFCTYYDSAAFLPQGAQHHSPAVA